MGATVNRVVSAKPSRKRKVIDIKQETFLGLSIIAASRGTNLKQFIENSLDEIVEAYDDAAIYKYLCKNEPEGLETVSEEEKLNFEKRFRL